MEAAKPFMVRIYDWQRRKPADEGALYESNGVLILREAHYDPDLGVTTEPGEMKFLEV